MVVPVNVYEAGEALVVVAPLPGVRAEDVSVAVEGHQLRIAAAMRSPAAKDYLVHEWHYGPFERVVDLPDGFGGGAQPPSVTASSPSASRGERATAPSRSNRRSEALWDAPSAERSRGGWANVAGYLHWEKTVATTTSTSKTTEDSTWPT